MYNIIVKKTKDILTDISGVALTPGNFGKDCLGNGEHFDEDGDGIDCCCDECDYLLCCTDKDYPKRCAFCQDKRCPR